MADNDANIERMEALALQQQQERPRKGRGGGGGGRRGGGGGGGGQDREVLLSKALSMLLRHRAGEAGVELDGEGYARLDKVVSKLTFFTFCPFSFRPSPSFRFVGGVRSRISRFEPSRPRFV